MMMGLKILPTLSIICIGNSSLYRNCLL